MLKVKHLTLTLLLLTISFRCFAQSNNNNDSVNVQPQKDTIVLYDLSKIACRIAAVKENSIIYFVPNTNFYTINYELSFEKIDQIKYINGETVYYNPSKGDSTNNMVLKNIKFERNLYLEGFRDYETNGNRIFNLYLGEIFFFTSFLMGPAMIVPAIISGSIKPKIPGNLKQAYYPESYKNGFTQAASNAKKSIIKTNVFGGIVFQILVGGYFLAVTNNVK